MGDADGNVKKESGSHDVEEGTLQSVLQARLSPLNIVILCVAVGLREEETPDIASILTTRNHYHVHDLHLCFNTSLIFN